MELNDEMRAKAAEARAENTERRRAAKEALRSGEATVADVLAMRGDRAVGRMTVAQMLRAVPGWGDVRVGRLLAREGIDPSKRLSALGPRQAEAIAAAVDGGRAK